MSDHMVSVGYSQHYAWSFGRIARWAVELSPEWENWDDAEAAVRRRWSGEAARRMATCQLRIARRFVEDGELPRSGDAAHYDRHGCRDSLCASFAAVVDAYESSPQAARKKASTVRNEVSNASSFLARLQEIGRTDPADVTGDDVIRALTDGEGRPAYSASHVKQVRAVLAGATPVAGVEGLLAFVQVPRRWRKVGDVLSAGEREIIDEALLDAGNGLSRRDCAIGRLLLDTGIRPSDIAALRCSDIDWENDRIDIVQRKTGQPLRLPLLPKVGNAIFDYIRGERDDIARRRGTGADAHVFLSETWPHRGLSAGSIGNIADRVLDAAGIRQGEGDHRGCRLFRRGLATAMLADGAGRPIIAATLGQTDLRTTERYICADVEGLRRFGLDVSRFPLGEGALE